jgi:hypothetical protein
MGMSKKSNIEKLNWVSRLLIAIAGIFVLASFILPFILTHFSVLDFTETGQIGDTVGGIMNPFISIASVAAMFLAFYMQFNANKLQRELFDKQIQNEREQFRTELDEQKKQSERDRFENQFFELLKIHKNNSNSIINTTFESEDGVGFGEEAARRQWEATKKRGFEYLVISINEDYNNWRKSPGKNTKETKRQTFTKVYSRQWNDSFGHYFRHLFLMVKFVVNRDDLSYKEKRDYLRIVRASLSTYEQIFLYYNWLADYAPEWEETEQHYFTDYRMIHNINPNLLIKDFVFTSVSPFKELLESHDYKKEEKRDIDSLFEYEDWARR